MDQQQTAAQLAQAQQHIQAQEQQIQQLTQQVQALVVQVQNLSAQPQPQPQAQVQPPAPKLPKPSLFTGERAASTLQPWLVQLKTHLAATPHLQLNSTQAVDVAAAYLGGTALIWYDTLKTAQGQTPFATWDLFTKAITSHYLPYDQFDDAFGRLKNLKQLGGALTYVNRFNELMLSLAGMDPHTQKLMFLSGLKPSVREAVEMQKPTDVATAQELAIRADNIQFQNRSRSSQPNYRPAQGSSSSGPTPMELGTHTAEPASGEVNTIRCYNCNEEGHLAPDCPKPRRAGGRGRGGRYNNRGGRNRGGRGRGRFNNTHHGAPN